MYSTDAVSRPEISAFLEQARAAERHFVAQRIFPVLGRTARAGRYPVIKIAEGDLLRRNQTKRSSSGRYNEVSQVHTWDTYDCVDRGLEQRVDDTKAEEMSSFFDLEKLASKNVLRKNLLDFEINAAALLLNESTFTAQDPTADYTEANVATADFPKDIGEAIDEVTGRGEEVNSIVMSYPMFLFLRRTTHLQQYLYGKLGDTVQKRLITPKDLADAFSLDAEQPIQVILGRAKYDTSQKGLGTSVLSPIWSDSHIWVGDVRAGEFDEGGVGRTLVWEADIPGGLFASETYRDEGRRSDMVRVRTNSVEKIVNENAGHLIRKTGS